MNAILPKRWPLWPTIIVGAALALMIYLGFWQLSRAQWKDSLIARYAKAATMPPMAWPSAPFAGEPPLYRYATGMCLEVVAKRAVAGRNRREESGYSHIVSCRTGAEGPGMAVDIGWSQNPSFPTVWKGGPVSGIIAPDSVSRMRLVADGAAPGLQPSAKPSLDAIPNNHRAYAVQWFLFAAVALIIYLVALKRRETDAK